MPPDVVTIRESLRVELIRQHLWAEAPASHIYLFSEATSTSDILRKLAKDGAREGTVVIAETQSAARGRAGKRWFSPPGVNLYASVLLRPEIPITAVPVFCFIASLALTESIWLERLPAAIKWPNDILVEGKKVGGTLVECVSRGDRVDSVILGVGVNLNVRREALEGALGAEARRATSLSEVAGREIERNRFTAMFLNLLGKWFQIYRTYGPEPVLYAWRERDVLTGRLAVIPEERGDTPHRVLGVNHAGHLVVEDPTGAVREVLTGEVRLLG